MGGDRLLERPSIVASLKGGTRTMEHLPAPGPTLIERATALLAKLPDLLSKIGTFMLGLVALWGIARGLPRFLNHRAVVNELLDERQERKRAENAARDYREAAERSQKTAETYRELYQATQAEANEAPAMRWRRIEVRAKKSGPNG